MIPPSSFPSLPTNLPSLELPLLYSQTHLGDPLERQWLETNLIGLFGPKTKKELEEDLEEEEKVFNTHGDAGPPAGQNAADGAEDDDEDDDDDDDRGQEEDSQVGGDVTTEGGGATRNED